MNHREPPHLPAATRRALHYLSLLLLPVLAPKGVDALPRAFPSRERTGPNGAAPAPYLRVVGVSPLRFEEAAPPPDLVTRPSAAAPPQPALSTTENSVAHDNAAAARSVSEGPVAPTPEPVAKPVPPAETPTAVADSTAAPAKPVAAILPDDARPAIRPEDFLPFFQIPGSARQAGDVTLFVPTAPTAPAPAPTLPPSSATYRQTP